jgi:hypothetical protein
MMDTFKPWIARKATAVVLLLLCGSAMTAAFVAWAPALAAANGHSPYSYKKGWNCKPGKKRTDGTYPGIMDPVSVQLVTKKSPNQLSQQIFEQSQRLRDLNGGAGKLWPPTAQYEDNEGQQGYYYSGTNRICSSFTNGNATGIAIDTRYHLRLHTGGASSAYPGFNIVAGTPHYDKLCGAGTNKKHEVPTWAGGRTQFLKLWPANQYRREAKRIGNVAPRKMKCLNLTVKSDGVVAFVFTN